MKKEIQILITPEIDSMIGQQSMQEYKIKAEVEAKKRLQQNQLGFNPFINP